MRSKPEMKSILARPYKVVALCHLLAVIPLLIVRSIAQLYLGSPVYMGLQYMTIHWPGEGQVEPRVLLLVL